MNNELRIDEYVNVARSTAVYPEAGRFYYPVLGVAGEFGETLDELFQGHGLKVEVPRRRIVSEIGDVLWYVVNTAADAGFDLHDITDIITGGLRCETFVDLCFQRKVQRDKRSPFLKASIAIGQLAEIAKKGIRDGYGTKLSVAKRAVVASALATVLCCLCEICEKYGICLGEAAKENNKKLTSRKKRDKIQGDGDDR